MPGEPCSYRVIHAAFRAARGRCPASDWQTDPMPSLFKFLVVVGIIAGAAYGVVYALANFVPLKPREMTVTITPDKFLKR